MIVLSGASIGRAGAAIRLARDLAPALVVLEDGDLVAEARDMSPGEAPLLFEPMNEMEAMADDADVAFVLTTHRADLLALYGAGLDLALADAEAVVTGTEGVTASFVRELLRKGAVVAALAGEGRVVDRHVAEALAELSHETRR